MNTTSTVSNLVSQDVIQHLQENFTFRGVSILSKKVKFNFTNNETDDAKEVSMDFDNVLFMDLLDTLKVVSLLLLAFEETVSEVLLIKKGFSYHLLGNAEVEFSDFEKAAFNVFRAKNGVLSSFSTVDLEEMNSYGSHQERKAYRLQERLIVTAISANTDQTAVSISAKRYRNAAAIENANRSKGSSEIFAASDKFTKVNYPKIDMGSIEDDELSPSHVGEHFIFYPELRQRFEDIKNIAFYILLRDIQGLIPMIKNISVELAEEELLRELEEIPSQHSDATQHEQQKQFTTVM